MKDICNMHPKISASKYHVINNGSDGDLAVSEKLDFSPNKKVIIGYAGSYYYTPERRAQAFAPWLRKRLNRMIQNTHRKEKWLYRLPFFFFKDVGLIFTNNPDLV